MKGELAAVANQYAEATLELALQADKGSISESGAAEKVYGDLKGVVAVFKNTPDITVILHHPSVPPEKKMEILLKTFEGKISDLTMRLLRLLADRRRLDIIVQLEDCYGELLRQKKGIVSAKLSTSKELSPSMVADIKARLTEHLGKKLELDVNVDRSLLGGVIL